MRQLLRFGYDGAGFAGWARQPGRRTVEGVLCAGLAQRFRSSTGTVSLEVSSRTDRGVHARANILALDSRLSGAALLRLVNGISPDIWFTATAACPPGLKVRRARSRTYRYYEPSPGWDLTKARATARLLIGPLDTRSFGRGMGAGRANHRTIDSISIEPHGDLWIVEVTARSFVWGMVRKLVGALREVQSGRLDPATLRRAAAGEARASLPLAEPERLVLWDVDLGVDWTVTWDGPNRKQTAYLDRRCGEAAVRVAFLGEVDGRPAPAPGARSRP